MQEDTCFSILIPARNEARFLPACLDSLLCQNYPNDRYEIIVIDDHSTDETSSIARAYAKEGILVCELLEIDSSPPTTPAQTAREH